MSVTVAEIRAGLRANLESYFDGYPVSGYEFSDPKPPCFEVAFRPDGGVTYNRAMARGLDEYNLIVRAIVPFALDQRSQEILDEFAAPTGSSSVRAAIESDPTLGGVVASLVVTEMSNYRAFQVAQTNVTFLAAEWAVTVYASGE